MEESLKLKKRQLLRNNEYYNIQDIFDELYSKSCKNYKFTNLMKFITSEANILLAFRNIKGNKGSKTVGIDNLDITTFENMVQGNYVEYIQNKFANYHPKGVRRVEIPKLNGKIRPLGIPCIEDRIIQQCIKQVLEPICEAKFYNHSYGFRPNRSTDHAIARCNFLMWKANLHYVVDLDIKGFFDNVNHSKLKKQIWALGIRDKNFISIMGKILKSEIKGIGIPTKGTPQGGIISPLLSNIVLNELDWWISSQWETFGTNNTYINSHKYRAMKTTKLKEVWLVRYADDFKIFCRDYKTAQKVYNATRKWLKERLDLDISPDKSRITNLRKNYTEFLGFKLKVKLKRKRYISQSRMSDKAKFSIINKLKKQIKVIQKEPNVKQVSKLNAMILGSHNYYNSATQVSLDFSKINFLVTKVLDIRLKQHVSDKPNFSKIYKRLYGKYNGKIRTICDITIFPIYACKNKPPMCFCQEISSYTIRGRQAIYTKLKGYNDLIKHLLSTIGNDQSTGFNDNRISLIAGQQGKCYVTREKLEIGNMECHHKIPQYLGGTDEYKNLVWINNKVHKLIHATKQEIIEKYLGLLSLDKKGLNRVNSLRKQVGNSVI
ncbi:group II intron reverse transcriptase/maturase [Clostridium sp. WILCCON 0269]|uniref:Group II intron reverse transcriptase/maturase n=1 Tax=Candidatus Clostridium eludens TaxID=3381663 RepID=A0ABW8SS36_9CLOT